MRPGLKDLFADSVHAVWRNARVLRERPGGIDCKNVLNALKHLVQPDQRHLSERRRPQACGGSQRDRPRRSAAAQRRRGRSRRLRPCLQVASNRVPASGSLLGTPARFVSTELGCTEQGGLGYVFM
jgi:hypothetical protein